MRHKTIQDLVTSYSGTMYIGPIPAAVDYRVHLAVDNQLGYISKMAVQIAHVQLRAMT